MLLSSTGTVKSQSGTEIKTHQLHSVFSHLFSPKKTVHFSIEATSFISKKFLPSQIRNFCPGNQHENTSRKHSAFMGWWANSQAEFPSWKTPFFFFCTSPKPKARQEREGGSSVYPTRDEAAWCFAARRGYFKLDKTRGNKLTSQKEKKNKIKGREMHSRRISPQIQFAFQSQASR